MSIDAEALEALFDPEILSVLSYDDLFAWDAKEISVRLSITISISATTSTSIPPLKMISTITLPLLIRQSSN